MMNKEISVEFNGQVFNGKVVNVVGDTVTMMEETSKQFFDFPVEMVTLKEIVLGMVAKVELENKYGNLSCYDYPAEYNQMIDLEVAICEALEKYNENEYSKRSSDLYENIEDIAKEIVNGNIDAENMELNYYSIDEWIEVYITSDMEEAEKSMFESLFYYMPTDVRNGWLEGNHLSNFTNTYTNVMIEYILMVHEG